MAEIIIVGVLILISFYLSTIVDKLNAILREMRGNSDGRN